MTISRIYSYCLHRGHYPRATAFNTFFSDNFNSKFIYRSPSSRFYLCRTLIIICNLLLDVFTSLLRRESNYFFFHSYSYPLLLLAYLLNFILDRACVIVDINYPFSDNTNYSKKLIIQLVSFVESTLMANSKNILFAFESSNQVRRALSRYRNLNRHNCIAIHSYYPQALQDTSIASPQSTLLDCLRAPYILFRGRFNLESGVSSIIEYFDAYCSLYPDGFNLVVHGHGPLHRSFLSLAESKNNKRIFIITDFLTEQNLNFLISHSVAMLGQFNNYKNRLNYTIPHKFYESLLHKKLYLTPPWPPLQPFLLRDSSKILFNNKSEYNLLDQLELTHQLYFNNLTSFNELSHAHSDFGHHLITNNWSSFLSIIK